MGVSCDEYIILTSFRKQALKSARRKILKVFSKNRDLKHYINCVQDVGGGMNSHYSLVIYPTGINGGYRSFDSLYPLGTSNIIEYIKALGRQMNKEADEWNLKHKKKLKNNYHKSKDGFEVQILAETDWGTTYDCSQLKQALLEGAEPELKWAINPRIGLSPNEAELRKERNLSKRQIKDVIHVLKKEWGDSEIITKLKKQYNNLCYEGYDFDNDPYLDEEY